MRIGDLIGMALRNLWKRKLRTFLTVLGVVIGTASIVVMVSIGIGMNESYKAEAEQWGSLQVINVMSANSNGGMVFVSGSGATSERNKTGVLNNKTIEEFRQIEGVEVVTPIVSSYDFQIICGKYVGTPQLIGLDPKAMDALGYKVAQGRLLEEQDKMMLVLGGEITQNFRNPKLSGRARWEAPAPELDFFNEKIQITFDQNYGTKNADKKIKPTKVEVTGILEGTGEESYSAIMPLAQLEKLMDDAQKYRAKNEKGYRGNNQNKKGTYDQAKVKVTDMNRVQEIQQQIKDMGFEAYSASDYLESMKKTTKMLRMMLGAIGAVSLVVAAIGIANTMIMSIYERTREIGVMKVIGASLRDIKWLFLTEAAFIGFGGGVFGVGFSLLVSKLVNILSAGQDAGMGGNMGMMSSIPMWLCFVALGFATIVGILAGYFPAKRAMKLSALSAIKTE